MTYNELQAKAFKLGMEKVVGKTTEELSAFIEENSPVATQPSEEAVKAVKQSEPKYNAATVFDGAREVRSYDLETHGKRFIELAQEFATSRKYRVEMGFIKGKTVCPSCGHAFN